MRVLRAFGVYLLAGFAVYLVIDLIRPGLAYTASVAGVVGVAAAIWWYRQDKRKAAESDSLGAR